MNLHISSQVELKGSLRVLGSKSQSIRALFVSTLAKGVSTLHCLPDSEDVNVAIKVCKNLGAKVLPLSCHKGCVRIESGGVPFSGIDEEIWTGNSGLTTRFVLPLLALSGGTRMVTVHAEEQMRNRPISPLIRNLLDLGVTVESKTWPVKMGGVYLGGETRVSGLSSQFISALLLSAPYAQKDVTLKVEDLNERPYMELTLDWLKKGGIRFEHRHEKNADLFHVYSGQNFSPIDYTVPCDYSSASTFFAMGALCNGSIQLLGLDPEDVQGDRRLLSILKEMGAHVEWEHGAVRVFKSPLHGIEIDANDVPDLVPTLAVLGTQAEGETKIFNVAQARLKETDRLHSMSESLKAMGAEIQELPDGLVVRQSRLHGAKVHGYSDHRTIMALALAGLLAEGETMIDTAEGLNKTYPRFVEDLQSLHAAVYFC